MILLDEVDNGNTLVIQQADHTDEAEYTCSVSAYRKTELKHDIRIRGKTKLKVWGNFAVLN